MSDGDRPLAWPDEPNWLDPTHPLFDPFPQHRVAPQFRVSRVQGYISGVQTAGDVSGAADGFHALDTLRTEVPSTMRDGEPVDRSGLNGRVTREHTLRVDQHLLTAALRAMRVRPVVAGPDTLRGAWDRCRREQMCTDSQAPQFRWVLNPLDVPPPDGVPREQRYPWEDTWGIGNLLTGGKPDPILDPHAPAATLYSIPMYVSPGLPRFHALLAHEHDLGVFTTDVWHGWTAEWWDDFDGADFGPVGAHGRWVQRAMSRQASLLLRTRAVIINAGPTIAGASS